MKHKTKIVLGVTLAVTASGLSSSCKDPGPARAGQAGSQSPAANPTMNPERTILTLRNLYEHRQYAKMTPWLPSEESDGFFRLLAGADRLEAANIRVQAIIQQKLALPASDRWDLSALRDNLGIFSDGVKVISTIVDGDRATVAFQVKDALPLSSANLIRHKGDWQYQPEIYPELPDQINQLADSLERLGDTLNERENLSPDQIDAEYRYRIVPRIKQLAAVDPQ
jgi:hypothetical protein